MYYIETTTHPGEHYPDTYSCEVWNGHTGLVEFRTDRSLFLSHVRREAAEFVATHTPTELGNPLVKPQ